MSNEFITCIVCQNIDCRPVTEGVKPAMYGTPVFDCPRCGKYIPVGPAQESLKSMLQNGEIDRSVLSHLIRESQRDEPLVILEEHLPAYRNSVPLPTPREQVEHLILCIGDNQKSPDDHAYATKEVLAATVGSRISDRERAFQWLLDEVKERWFRIGSHDGSNYAFSLLMEGWNFYEQLQHKRAVSRTTFMAMQFNDTVLQAVFTDCFKPAAAKAGFELRLVNEGQGAGLIDNQIRAAIRAARFVVADLSHDNNGAYFEAGFGEGLGLPVIYTCEAEKFKQKKTHFDTNHMVIIPWDTADLDSAAKRLTATIRNTLPAEAMMSSGE